MTEEKNSIAKALLRAQQEIVGVDKESRNQFQQYDYTSCEVMLRACRAVLHKNGLMVRRGDCDLHQTGNDYHAHMKFILMHPESGEVFDDLVVWPVIQAKGKPLDKAFAATLSTSLNYWLRDLLQIPRGLDEEVDQRDDSRYDPNRKKTISSAGHYMLALSEATTIEQCYEIGEQIRNARILDAERKELRKAYTARLRQLGGEK